VQYDTLIALLFKHGFGEMAIHEAASAVRAIAEIVQQVA
jgi:hypothetical protein